MHPTEQLKWVGGNDYPDPTDESVDVLYMLCPYISTVAAWTTVTKFNNHRNQELLELSDDGSIERNANGWRCEICKQRHPHDIVLARASID